MKLRNGCCVLLKNVWGEEREGCGDGCLVERIFASYGEEIHFSTSFCRSPFPSTSALISLFSDS